MLASDLLWAAIGLGLVAYALTGGAGLGSGVWHLLARGERRDDERRLIEAVMGRMLELNHVWLVVSMVLMFTAFPAGMGAIHAAVALPLAVAALAIGLRAVAVAAGASRRGASRGPWFRIVQWASVVTPIALGMSLAGLVTGTVSEAGRQIVLPGWTQPFGWLLGAMVLSLFALIAAVYLAVEAPPSLVNLYRQRAITCQFIAGVLSLGTLTRVYLDAPLLHARLLGSWWSTPHQILTAGAAIAATVFLWQARIGRARVAVCVQVTLVVGGWGLAMNRHVLLRGPSLENLGPPSIFAVWLLVALPVVVFIVHMTLPMARRVTHTLPVEPQDDAPGGEDAPEAFTTTGP